MTSSDSTSVAEVPSLGLRDRIIGLLHRRATWVLVDQGVVSAGNFLTANLIGRNVSQAQFGSYQFLIETILYLNSLQAALVIYPLTLKGATTDRKTLGRLATASMFLTALLLPLLGSAAVITVGALKLWQISLSAIFAMVFWQLQETLRRALIADLRYSDAIWGDGISYLGQVAVVFVLARLKMLNVNTALLAIGATSAVAIIVQAFQVGLRRFALRDLWSVLKDFSVVGKWMLLSNSTTLITSLGYWWVMNYKIGPEECAAFGAIALLFKLANPVMQSMSGLIVPAVARAASRDGGHAATRVAGKYILFGGALLAPYFALLALFPGTSLTLAYKASSPYVALAPLLRLFTINYTIVYLATVFGAWLNGLGRSQYSFYVQVVNVIATLLIGLPMTSRFGAKGVIIGGMIVTLCCAAALGYFIHRTIASFAPPASDPSLAADSLKR